MSKASVRKVDSYWFGTVLMDGDMVIHISKDFENVQQWVFKQVKRNYDYIVAVDTSTDDKKKKLSVTVMSDDKGNLDYKMWYRNKVWHSHNAEIAGISYLIKKIDEQLDYKNILIYSDSKNTVEAINSYLKDKNKLQKAMSNIDSNILNINIHINYAYMIIAYRISCLRERGIYVNLQWHKGHSQDYSLMKFSDMYARLILRRETRKIKESIFIKRKNSIIRNYNNFINKDDKKEEN